MYLTWNTRYNSVDYENAVKSVKNRKPTGEPSVTKQRGKSIKQTEQLVRFEDMDFETGYEAIKEIADGS